MERQVQHLVRLVDDLLDVSRMTTGEIKLRREPLTFETSSPTPWRPAVKQSRPRNTASPHARSVRRTGGRWQSYPPRPGPDQHPEQCRQVHRGPAAEIDIAAARSGDVVEIRVRDSGVGISAERLPRIFDLFSQSDPSPDRAHGGLGVGLTLARRLVDMHAGELTASSAGPGRGSEFRIALPALTPAPIRQAASPSASRFCSETAHRSARARRRRPRGRHAGPQAAPSRDGSRGDDRARRQIGHRDGLARPP